MEAEYQRRLTETHSDLPRKARVRKVCRWIALAWLVLALAGFGIASTAGINGWLIAGLSAGALAACLPLPAAIAPERVLRWTIRHSMFRLDELHGPQNPNQFM